jgi:hypothetical protein
MEHIPVWEADSHTAIQEILLPFMTPVQSQMYLLHVLYARLFEIMSSHLCIGLPGGHFHSDFSSNMLYAFLVSQFVLHDPPILLSMI